MFLNVDRDIKVQTRAWKDVGCGRACLIDMHQDSPCFDIDFCLNEAQGVR